MGPPRVLLATSCMMRLPKAQPTNGFLAGLHRCTEGFGTLSPRVCVWVETEHAMSLCGGRLWPPHTPGDQDTGQRSGLHWP